jgi:N-acetylmannosamine-6-phosphate 2-epimerase/N-acetylmannosamine kinase
LPRFVEVLRGRLIVSCQPVKDGPLDRPEFVVAFSLAALHGGAAGMRIESARNVRAVRAATEAPIIGLAKRQVPPSLVFITPEIEDVRTLADCGADIIAFDATLRPRPVSIRELVSAIHATGKLAMADIATPDDARAAADAGVDLMGTTLSGYLGGPVPSYPDTELVSRCADLGIPVLAEGRYRTPDQARLAIEAGAYAVVVGSAITRPEHVTAWFVDAMSAAGHAGSSSKPILAVDLGGTKTLVALVVGCEILESRRIATQKARGPEAWLDAIAEAASDWRGRFTTAAIAVTGAVKSGRWWSLNPAVLPIPPGFPLVEELSYRLDAIVTAMNDAQAAAWGEYRLGAGKDRDMVFLTISTGIGGGIVLGGRLITGRGGLSGHIGQMKVCVDGGYRRFEDVASAGALEREATARGHQAEGHEIVRAADAGEIWAEEIIENSADRLAVALGSIQMAIDPDCFILGGGLGLATGYLDRVRRRLTSIDEIMRPELRPAALGAYAGLLGVADLARSRQFTSQDRAGTVHYGQSAARLRRLATGAALADPVGRVAKSGSRRRIWSQTGDSSAP